MHRTDGAAACRPWAGRTGSGAALRYLEACARGTRLRRYAAGDAGRAGGNTLTMDEVSTWRQRWQAPVPSITSLGRPSCCMLWQCNARPATRRCRVSVCQGLSDRSASAANPPTPGDVCRICIGTGHGSPPPATFGRVRSLLCDKPCPVAPGRVCVGACRLQSEFYAFCVDVGLMSPGFTIRDVNSIFCASNHDGPESAGAARNQATCRMRLTT